MKLSVKEKEAVLKAKKENDYCTITHRKTMKSLVEKNLAKYTSGFGYRWGSIIELNEEGKKLQLKLIS